MTWQQPAHKLTAKLNSRGPSMSEIKPRLYLGDIIAALSKNELKKVGITDMITVEVKQISTDDLADSIQRYLFINVMDHSKQDILTHFEVADKFIEDALKVETNKVFVHCVAGVSRSASIVIAHMMKSKSLVYTDAIALVKKRRNVVDPNEGFVKQLALYQRMGYKIDISNIEYRHLVLEALVFEFKLLGISNAPQQAKILSFIALKPSSKGQLTTHEAILSNIGILFEQYYDKISLRNVNRCPDIYDETDVYRCKKCRAVVFYGISVVENKSLNVDRSAQANPTSPPSQLAAIYDRKVARNDMAARKKCPLIFIEPQPWMQKQILAVKGVIECYQCKKKLGKFDWLSAESCDCDLHTSHMNLNIFKISRQNVDEPSSFSNATSQTN